MEFLALFSIVFLVVCFLVDRKFISIVVSLSITLALFFLIDQAQMTNFNKLYSKELRDNPTFESVTIRIYEPNEGLPEQHFETTVHDEEIIDQIVSNLEEIKLKRGIHPNGHISDYSLDFVTKREIKDRIYEYFNIYVYWNQDSLNMNKIVGDRQSVETIEALIQNIDANWKEVVYHEFE